MKTIEQILEENVQCECGEIYKSRGLVAPDCPLCSYHSQYVDAIKEYALQLLEEIVDNIGYYTEGEGCTYINEKHIKELKKQINNQ